GAHLAAQQAVSDGVQLVIGPLFAESVAAAASVTREANIPMIAFSTDSSVAGRGVYLLSFLPESDISQIIGFAVAQGRQSFSALLPNTSYGTLVEGAFQQAVARHGGRVVAIERYPLDRQGMMEPTQRLSESAKGNNPQADAILIPDGPSVIPSLVPLLALNGVKTSKVKLLGSGQWADERALKEPSLVGGWYPAASPAGWTDFSARFQETYGTEPPRIASIAYDAVNLASALAALPPEQRYTPATLTNPNGFAGVDGIFRFRSNGLNDRGLAILEVKAGGQTKVLREAPKAFGPESF
ncbi:MAG: penicillin-binding protein activator, partial [Fimbriimonadaceae bacterium]|nr:penicillin-binding protein activator [Alphaproteobacteria bacterium]